MAISKALQTQEWWAEISSACGPRRVTCWALPGRARCQATASLQKARHDQMEADQRRLHEWSGRTVEATAHAKYRKAQRNLSDPDINYVLAYGQTLHKAGAVFTYLREKDIPYADRVDQRCQKLIGAVVVMTTEGERRLLTAYRNRRFGLRYIKRKLDYTRSR